MQKTPDNTDRSMRESGGSSTPADAGPQHGHTRTAAAGREFLRALGSDLTGLALALRQYRLRKRAQAAHATPIRRGSFARATLVVLRRFAVGIVALATIGAL